MAPRLRVAFAILVALLALQAGGSALADSHASEPTWSSNTTMWIELQSDGDARWTVSMTVDLPDEESTESFRAVADEFESGDSDVLSVDTFRRYVSLSNQATGREMQLTNESRTASVSNDTGRLAVTFTWTEFGRLDGEKLRVADAFDGPERTWLPGLTADQRLVIEGPQSFDIVDAPSGISIRNRTIRWSGPERFDEDYLSITYATDGDDSTVTRTSTPSVSTPTRTPTTTTAVGGPDSGSNVLVFALGALVVVLLGVGAYVLRFRSDDEGGADPDAEESDDDDATAGESDEESEFEPVADESTEVGGSESVSEPDPIDRELLSDEEYVEALIERNGGRMKQADIVTETDWSNAKVSQLLSAMAEDGRIEKLRIGRENLISFPDEDSEDGDETV